jgi:hypothetical protein
VSHFKKILNLTKRNVLPPMGVPIVCWPGSEIMGGANAVKCAVVAGMPGGGSEAIRPVICIWGNMAVRAAGWNIRNGKIVLSTIVS